MKGNYIELYYLVLFGLLPILTRIPTTAKSRMEMAQKNVLYVVLLESKCMANRP